MCRTFHFYLFINYAFYAYSAHSKFWSINIFFVIFLILDHSLFQMLPTLSFICVWINFQKFSNKPTQTICLSNILDFLWHIVTLRYFHNIYIIWYIFKYWKANLAILYFGFSVTHCDISIYSHPLQHADVENIQL